MPAGGSARLFHQYRYPEPGATPPVATMKVNNDPLVTTSYETDGSGRPVRVTNPAGQDATATWNGKDLPVWTKDHTNRITATVYDALDRPTDTWGPYREDCFADSTAPDGTTVKSPIDTPPCKGSMPHTTTGYDQGLTGLAATWWNNLTLTAAPAGHSTTTTPGGHGTSTPHSTVTTSAGYSARYTGYLTLPAGTYTLAAAASSIGDDGFRLYLDDQLALERWNTYTGAIAADQPADQPAGQSAGYWPLGETSGTIANAANAANGGNGGNGGNATYVGPVTLGATGALIDQPDSTTAAEFPGAAALTLPTGAGSATSEASRV